MLCFQHTFLILSPYLSASFDPDLTETAVILHNLLVVCQYFSPSLDPDLTETAVILAYLTATIRIPLSASLDPDLTEGLVILAYLLVVCQYFPASFGPDFTETAQI